LLSMAQLLASDGFQIEAFTVIPSKNQIQKADTITHLTPKMIKVLCCLAAHHGKLVTKERLLSEVWRNVSVTDLVLSRAIADLRKAFGETAKNAQFIRTISKRGYCLTKPITLIPVASESRNTPMATFKQINAHLLTGVALGLPLILIFLWYLLSVKDTPSIPRTITHLTTDDQAWEYHPRFSHDGKQVAYVQLNNKNGSTLILKDLKTNLISQLKISEAEIRAPAFSPDGQHLAYFELTRDNCELIIWSLKTSHATKKYPCETSTSRSLDWSADSQFLLTTQFNKARETEEPVVFDIETGQSRHLISLSKKQSGLLFPRWSPSGQKIAALYYEPSANRWSVATMSLDESAITYHHTENNFLNQIEWGRNEDTLFYAVASGEKTGIWQLNKSSGQKTRIIYAEAVDMDFDPVSNQFVIAEEKRDIDIWSFDFSNQRHRKISHSAKIERIPSVSADQKYLAYISNQSNGFNIWLNELSTGKSRQLTHYTKGLISDLKWHPDSQRLFYSYGSQGQNQIYQISLTEQISQPFNTKHNERFLDWSTDGQHMYFLSDRQTGKWAVFSFDIAANKISKVIDFPVAQLRAIPPFLYFQKNDSNNLYRLNLQAEDHPIEKMDGISRDLVSWDVNKNTLLMGVAGKFGDVSFLEMDLTTNQPSRLATVNPALGRQDRFVSYSAENIFYYAKMEHLQRDIILYSPAR